MRQVSLVHASTALGSTGRQKSSQASACSSRDSVEGRLHSLLAASKADGTLHNVQVRLFSSMELEAVVISCLKGMTLSGEDCHAQREENTAVGLCEACFGLSSAAVPCQALEAIRG